MSILKPLIFILMAGWLTLVQAQGIVIQRISKTGGEAPVLLHPTHQPYQEFVRAPESIKVAFLSAPSLIGAYSQSTYTAALATLLSKPGLVFTFEQFSIPSESAESIQNALKTIQNENYDCIIAPLTLSGTQKLAELAPAMSIYVPTIHKKELSYAPSNILFGGIDYEAQIEALKPFMAPSLAIFYGDSPVGKRLKSMTEALAHKMNASSYAINKEGSNIITHLSKPSSFTKKSILLHTPVVKSSMIAAHTTFMGIREHNFLSTQVNMDPALLTLTQYNDRKNMIIANSIIEHSPTIYHYNALYNNDISFDWVNYSTTIGTDMLISQIMNTPREYTLPITDSQVQYPIQLVRPKEFGFESIPAR